MGWFDTYVSNTIGGSGNQFYFEAKQARTGRAYYRLLSGGKYRYSLLFSNVIDSTFEAGDRSRCNLVCEEWEILSAFAGICAETGMEEAGEVKKLIPLTFGGSPAKGVRPGEFFTSDPVELEAEKGEYLCVQIEYRGGMLPWHPESILPLFVQKEGKWVPDKQMPLPGMIGCDRAVRARIGYFGDSITQGIGTAPNAYEHWNALVSEALGPSFSYWNLGLGYGRAQDAASMGAWFDKARRMDGIVLTFGTNDIGYGRSAEQICGDLTAVVKRLKEEGVSVLIQTIPPFDWKGEAVETWESVNAYIAGTLSETADLFFDVVPVLEDRKKGRGAAGYGGHPDAAGCLAWADALLPKMREFAAMLSEGLSFGRATLRFGTSLKSV